MSSSWAVLTFLKTWHEDRLAGRARELTDYLARFPGREAEVRAEFDRLQAAAAERTPRDGAPGVRGLGRYRLIDVLGRGGQATVWRAEDERLQRTVAVKVLEAGAESPAAALRLLREANVTSRLRDPGICPIFDAGTEDGRVYFVMDLVPGDSLGALLGRAAGTARPPLALPGAADGVARSAAARVLSFVERLARTVQVAHEAGVVHRDVKPGNVMVTPAGHPVILDFGLALDGAPGITATRGGQLGTPAYMAPEQVLGDRAGVGVAADVWALGVVLYECLTLTRPFAAPGLQALYRAILEEDPDLDLPGIPAAVRPVLACALAKDPAQRYLTAADLADDLRRVRAGALTHARLPGLVERARRTVRRRPALSAGLAITFVALGLWLVFAHRMLEREQGLRGEAERASRSAEAQRIRAEQGFAELRELLETMVWRVHGAIRDLPGAAPARQLVLTQAARYLEVLEQQAGDDDGIKRTLAATYIKLGDVQGHPGTQSLGDLDAAVASYDRARGHAQALLARSTADLELEGHMLTIDTRLADVAHARGDTDEAVRLARTVIARADALREAHPDDRRVLLPLLSAHNIISVAEARSDASPRAHLRAAVEIGERIWELDRDTPTGSSALVGALINQALGLERGMELDAAIGALRRARGILRESLRRFPDNFDLQDRMVALCGPYARLLARSGDRTASIRVLDEAISDQERMVAGTDASLAAVRRLCTVYGTAIHLMRGHGDRARTRELLGRMRARVPRLTSPQATTDDLLHALWVELWATQDALETGDRDGAVAAWQRAAPLLERERLRPVLATPALAANLDCRAGHVALAQGRVDEARRIFDRGLAHLGEHAAQLPGLHVEMLLGRGLARVARSEAAEARTDLVTARAALAGGAPLIVRLRGEWCERLAARLQRHVDSTGPGRTPR